MTTSTQELSSNPAAQPRGEERLSETSVVKPAFKSVPDLLGEPGKHFHFPASVSPFCHIKCLGLCSPDWSPAPASLCSQGPGVLHCLRFRFLLGAERGQVSTVLNLCAREAWLPAQCQACLTPVSRADPREQREERTPEGEDLVTSPSTLSDFNPFSTNPKQQGTGQKMSELP